VIDNDELFDATGLRFAQESEVIDREALSTRFKVRELGIEHVCKWLGSCDIHEREALWFVKLYGLLHAMTSNHYGGVDSILQATARIHTLRIFPVHTLEHPAPPVAKHGAQIKWRLHCLNGGALYSQADAHWSMPHSVGHKLHPAVVELCTLGDVTSHSGLCLKVIQLLTFNFES